MVDFLTELTSSLSCLRKFGFRLVGESEPHEREMNSFVAFEKENIRVRFVCDHGFVFGEIGPKSSKKWYLFDTVAELIGADPRPVDPDLTQSGLHLRLRSFLQENFVVINYVFSSTQVTETERRLESLGMQRARRIFPPEAFRLIDEAEANEKGSNAEPSAGANAE